MDLAAQVVELPPVRLVHAALIFEHAGLDRCLENALSLVGPNRVPVHGAPTAGRRRGEHRGHSVSPIQALKPHFSLIDPAQFGRTLEGRGFRLEFQTRRPLPEGKAFWMGISRRWRSPMTGMPLAACGNSPENM